jgi:signal transduction histidine kinase
MGRRRSRHVRLGLGGSEVGINGGIARPTVAASVPPLPGDRHTSVVTVPRTWPFSTRRSLQHAIALLAVTVVLLGAVVLAFVAAAATPEPLWPHVLNLLVAWLYVAAGLLAWSRRPSNRFGIVIVGGGLAILLADMGATGVPVLIAASLIVATLPLALLVHVLHAFPSGRLLTPASRRVVLGVYVVSLMLQAPLYLFTKQKHPYDVLMLADRPDLAARGLWVQAGAGCAVVLATTVILIGRLRRADPRRRRALAPLYGYGILVVLFIPISANLLTSLFGLTSATVFVLQLIAVAGVPVAFTLALLRGGFARTGEIDELGSWLGTAEAGRTPLAAAVARALGDDSVRLIFWVPERHGYVGANGEPAQPLTEPERGLVEIELAGERVGAIDYDTTLNADPAPVRAAGRVIAMAVDHERVTAELRASQQALRHSRARIVKAGDTERRRIARDLHDGLQMRLVLLAMQAQEVAKNPETPADTRTATTALRVGIDAAAAELRNLVHAVLPAALIERGLCAATEDLIDRLPVPTRLEMSVAEHSLSPVVESTAYFVVAEALTNALKHAQPTVLQVGLARIEDRLRIEVTDNGKGGACIRTGSGLRGLSDRVETLGGRLEVHSPPDHGTRIVAELPCAS